MRLYDEQHRPTRQDTDRLDLLHELLHATADVHASAPAITDRSGSLSYAEVSRAVGATAAGFAALGVRRGDRVAVWLPKSSEAVIALFGAMHAGGVAVPVNILLKAPQVAHILRDSEATILVTTQSRANDLTREAYALPDLQAVVVVDEPTADGTAQTTLVRWQDLNSVPPGAFPRNIDSDVASLFYTSGSTGRPKGVVLSHRNMVIGARSVSTYLGNASEDRLLALLSFSFDYGFSQLSTAFNVGASVVLLDYMLPQEVMVVMERERVTGLAAVPPVWIQLADLKWPDGVTRTLRYITNSGGTMPQATLGKLRRALPQTRVFLMYGLTEAFRSTYLPPEEIDRRPDSIGKAIPGAEILVLKPDGTPCEAHEPGELVHRGALVSMGYWKDPERTAERFKPVPPVASGVPLPELAVWSGDVVRRDEEGFLYFVGRRDEMIKTSAYRVSPTEVEEEVYATGLVTDAVALGVPHTRLGQAILLVASPPPGGAADSDILLAALRQRLPRYMAPLAVEWRDAIPRNANGKFDRARLRQELSEYFSDSASAATDASGGGTSRQ